MLLQSFLVVPIAAFVAFFLGRHGLESTERKLVGYAFLAHLVMSVLLIVYHVYIYGGGDLNLYVGYARDVAHLVRFDAVRYAPELLNLLLQRETSFPFSVLLEGTASASMMGMTAITALVFGDSVYALCLAFSLLSFIGTVDLYKAVRFKLERSVRIPVLVGTLFVPSVVFWTSGVIKEAVVVAGLGIFLRGISDLLIRKRVIALVSVVFGATLVTLIKPYVLAPLVLALGAWFYAGRGRRLPLGYKLAGVAIGIGGLALIGYLFPMYGVDGVAQTLSNTQRNFVSTNIDTGSAIDIGDVDGDVDPSQRSLASALKWAPMGLLNALLRPLFFDVRNVSMAVAAVEMTVLFGLVVSIVYRHGVRKIVREIGSDAPLLFAAVFVLVFATSVGIATGNLGSLSRYRVPMMPVYVGAVLAVRARLDARVRERAALGGSVTTRASRRRRKAPVLSHRPMPGLPGTRRLP